MPIATPIAKISPSWPSIAVPTVVKNNDTVGNKFNALSKLPIPTIIAPAAKQLLVALKIYLNFEKLKHSTHSQNTYYSNNLYITKLCI